MKLKVTRLAIETTQTPMSIWNEIRAKFYPDTDNSVWRGLSMEQSIKLIHKTRALHFGGDSHGRVEVPPLSNVKNSKLRFFQFHHVWYDASSKKSNGIERLIGWAHPAAIQLLRYENVSLFVDGTFRIVPANYKQCVVLMVFDRGTKLYVLVFFVLSTCKTFDAYWSLFQFVTNACGQKIQAKDIVCDFEASLINAVADWFEGARTIGCLFHFKQACGRRMTKYRIPSAEASIAMVFGVLDMLTVIEVDKIPKQGVRWVRARIRERCIEDGIRYSTKKWNQFWKYFRRTWLSLYPPALWNIRDVQHTIVARTNNPLERFNRELNTAFASPHPSLPRFVQTIEGVAREHVNARTDITNGNAKAPKRTERIKIPTAVELPDASDDASGCEDEVDEDGCSNPDNDLDEADQEARCGFDEDSEQSFDPDDIEDIIDDEGYAHEVAL